MRRKQIEIVSENCENTIINNTLDGHYYQKKIKIFKKVCVKKYTYFSTCLEALAQNYIFQVRRIFTNHDLKFI